MNLERLEDQVHALIEKNQKVEAIKLVLEATGWGLKESKEYVDSLEATQRRRKRRRKRSEGRRESPVLQVGDSVRVKPGILDPDFGIEIREGQPVACIAYAIDWATRPSPGAPA
jgi:hypothetical protein